MNRIFIAIVLLLAAAGCMSYSELKTDVGNVKVNGKNVAASYAVVNVSYKLLGCIPLTNGDTWKTGSYGPWVGGMDVFSGECSLDDNLASVRHAREMVGGGEIANLVSRDDVYHAWSLFLVEKEVLKTSCIILAP